MSATQPKKKNFDLVIREDFDPRSLSPAAVAKLTKAGHSIAIARSDVRAYSEENYINALGGDKAALANLTFIDEGAWRTDKRAKNAYIFAVKELPSESPTSKYFSKSHSIFALNTSIKGKTVPRWNCWDLALVHAGVIGQVGRTAIKVVSCWITNSGQMKRVIAHMRSVKVRVILPLPWVC